MGEIIDKPIEEVSHRVIYMDASQPRGQIYDEKFRVSFLRTINNPEEEGLLTPHLFYDIESNDTEAFLGLAYNAKEILSGGGAWERHIEDNTAKSAKDSFWNSDQRIIAYALQNGLVDLLPRTIKFVSYGCGDRHAYESNEFQIIKGVKADPNRDITDSCAVDILKRYAVSFAYDANLKFNIRSQGVVGDFLYNGKLAIEETRGTPVVMIFGGPFENTPITKDAPDPIETTAIAWAKMNIQHGLGSTVIKSFDADQTPQSQLNKYKITRNFEAFVLSAFARAAAQGIIENRQYDVFRNWKLVREFDTNINAVKLIARCKKNDSVIIAGAKRSFEKDKTQRTIILSHKWNENVHRYIAQRAGYDIKAIYEQNENPNKLMVAEAIRRPDADLMKKIAPNHQ